MYSVALVLKSTKLLAKLTALHIWGEQTSFEIEAVFDSADSFRDILRVRSFDLVVIENSLVEENDFKLLKKFRNNKACGHIALCSSSGDFEAARKGIVIGIDDYFTLPFNEDAILSLFKRITAGNDTDEIALEKSADKMFELFNKQDDSVFAEAGRLYDKGVSSDALDILTERVFDEYDWLDLYMNEDDFLSSNGIEAELHLTKFYTLYKNYTQLNPPHNETLEEIINYILYNPESDLRQKSLSEELHINKSYLSTVFIAQTGIRFVDYITNVKLLRAAWLLKNTQMKVSEIANRMDYKDTAYFSKQFKKNFGFTPSEYRMPDDYHYII